MQWIHTYPSWLWNCLRWLGANLPLLESLDNLLASEDWWWWLLSLALAPREEAKADAEVEVAATGEGSWWVLVDWALLCEPDPPCFLDFSLEALSIGEDVEFLAPLWEDCCLWERCCLKSPTLFPVSSGRIPCLTQTSPLLNLTRGWEGAGSMWGGRPWFLWLFPLLLCFFFWPVVDFWRGPSAAPLPLTLEVVLPPYICPWEGLTYSLLCCNRVCWRRSSAPNSLL